MYLILSPSYSSSLARRKTRHSQFDRTEKNLDYCTRGNSTVQDVGLLLVFICHCQGLGSARCQRKIHMSDRINSFLISCATEGSRKVREYGWFPIERAPPRMQTHISPLSLSLLIYLFLVLFFRIIIHLWLIKVRSLTH